MIDKELKTLKEAHDFYEKNWKELKMDFIDYLKAEAVKYVKELRRRTETTGKLDYRLSFKHFFNITEEDLQGDNQ